MKPTIVLQLVVGILLAAGPVVLFAAQDEIAVTLTDIQYGMLSYRNNGIRVTQTTTDIPLVTGNAFGAKMEARVDRGNYYLFFVEWEIPSLVDSPTERIFHNKFGEYVYLERIASGNDKKLQAAWVLNQPWKLIPGRYTLRIYLAAAENTRRQLSKTIVSGEEIVPIQVYERAFNLYPPSFLSNPSNPSNPSN